MQKAPKLPTKHMKNSKELRILQWNAQSLNPHKAQELSYTATEQEAQILCISELSHIRSIPKYTHITSSDPDTQSGLFIFPSLRARKREVPSEIKE